MPLAFAVLDRAGQTRRLKRLARLALAEHDIPAATLTLLPNGWNTNFRVDRDHVLRVRATTPRFAEAETTWLTALAKDTTLGVPEPVPTRTGEYVTTVTTPDVPGRRTCVLYRWVEGRFHGKSLSADDIRKVGEFTAHLQRHGKTMPPLARNRVDTLPDHTAQLAADLHSPEAGVLFERAVTRIRATLAALGNEAHGLIHADLHQENFLFHQGEVRAIDFDDCGYGHHLYDLAATISELDDPSLRAPLLEGYRSVSPLEHEEALEDLLLLRRLQLTTWVVQERHLPQFRGTWAATLARTVDRLRG
ncbi:phosphotransferase enzyme family protein [Umezawaea endophytica]|uniref:Phosphotransferase n=1 Tax=Umezawaea endophytica TaxID=1654476 RepID=A0A9X2VNM9_9PSEU|nr:phosphotransferase [Umezawaea endophytica]MCS7479840.1 phosphotransferase [Umezawaea endophytica]